MQQAQIYLQIEIGSRSRLSKKRLLPQSGYCSKRDPTANGTKSKLFTVTSQ